MASKAVTVGDLIHRAASSCLSNRLSCNYTLRDSGDSDLEDEDPFADAVSGSEKCRHSPSAAEVEEGQQEEAKREAPRARVTRRRRSTRSPAYGARTRRSRARTAPGTPPRCGPRTPPWSPSSATSRASATGSAAPPPPRAASQPFGPAALGGRGAVRGRARRPPAPAPREAGRGRRAQGEARRRHHPAAASKPNGGTPTADLFVCSSQQARAATRALAGQVLHLMRAAGPDLASATRSLTRIPVPSSSSPRLAKRALEAHATRVLLGGFEHESFYLDGSLSSLLDPAAFRRERYAQFRDMRGMEPAELLGVLPTCAFGRYAASKFAALLPPRVEEAVLGDGEHGKAVRAAKAAWMLHLLAFALDPPPSLFEAGRGAEFHMESVTGAPPHAGAGMVVGFAVAPGFRLGNGAVVRARVFLVPR